MSIPVAASEVPPATATGGRNVAAAVEPEMGTTPATDSRSAPATAGRAVDRDPPSAQSVQTPHAAPDTGVQIEQSPDAEVGASVTRLQEIPGLSREERAALRRRVNLLVFAASAAILAIAVACLLLWRS